MMPDDVETAVAKMGEVVTLWSVDRAYAADLIRATSDVLAAGGDGPSLRMLAAVSIRNADDEDIRDVVEPALREIGLTHEPKNTAAREDALMVMARRTLRGVATPRELVDFARYDYWPPSARRLSEYERLAGDLAMMYAENVSVSATRPAAL